MTISRDEIEAARLTSELKYILDNQSMRVSAERRGHTAGIQEGRAEGLAEGLEKGLQKRGLEIARNLKAAGVSSEVIYQTTGLKLEEIG